MLILQLQYAVLVKQQDMDTYFTMTVCGVSYKKKEILIFKLNYVVLIIEQDWDTYFIINNYSMLCQLYKNIGILILQV